MTRTTPVRAELEHAFVAAKTAGIAAWIAVSSILPISLVPITMQAQIIVETKLPDSGRPLSLALPKSEPTPGAPIVVSLHYGGPVPAHYGRGLLEQVVAPGLESLDAVMVAPDCPAKAWADTACAQNVFEAVELAAERYSADRNRVVLAGYSKGGIGAWALSDAHPRRFAAIVVMAGRGANPSWTGQAPGPAYVIHGEDDEIFSLAEVRSSIDARVSAGQSVSLTELPGVSHYDTGAFVSPLREAAAWIGERLSNQPQ